jgi:virginiamycin B lyase
MRGRRAVATAVPAITVAAMSAWSPSLALAAVAFDSTSLQGQVSSAEEGPMEGVLVSAKQVGSTTTITVISDEHGHYRFPRNRLIPGHYALTINATGYSLDGSAGVDFSLGKTSAIDLSLTKAANLAPQLSNAEWIISAPGTPEQKSTLLNCVDCHTLNRPVESAHTADEFIQVLSRMATYAYNSQPSFPQHFVQLPSFDPEQRFRKTATYLSSINRSVGSTWSYQLQTLPRIKGKGTRVIFTEYALPRQICQPHDVILDTRGYAWYTDFGQQFIGRLDPKTGAVKEFPLPLLKPGSPVGELDLENGREGHLWVGMHFQGALADFDTRTEKFRIHPLSQELQKPNIQTSMLAAEHVGVDGRIWSSYTAKAVARLTVKTGKFEIIYPFGGVSPAVPEQPARGQPATPPVNATAKPALSAEGEEPQARPVQDSPVHVLYGLATDLHNNLFAMDFLGRSVFKIDANTHQVTEFPTSTGFSRPRRGHMDSQNRLWFAEYNANRIGMLDTNTGKMKEWELPTAWTAPYDVVIDKNGEAWTAGETTDRVVRLNTHTGEVIEYPLPRPTNGRRVFVDNRTNPVTFWIGNNHDASIVKLEPLE